MTNSQRLSTVRDRLIQWLKAQTATNDETTNHSPTIHSESILIRDGFYVGRRFELGTHRAVWFLEEDELKIFTRSGGLAAVLVGPELNGPVADDHEPRLLALPPAAARKRLGASQSDGDCDQSDRGDASGQTNRRAA